MTLCARFDWFMTDRGVGFYPRVNSQVCYRLCRKILCLFFVVLVWALSPPMGENAVGLKSSVFKSTIVAGSCSTASHCIFRKCFACGYSFFLTSAIFLVFFANG